MKIDEILDLMDQLLDHAKPIPFASHKVIIDGDRMRELINDMRMNKPEEIRRAKLIEFDCERIMQEAHVNGERIVQEAEQRAKKLVAQQTIMMEARERAVEMVTKAQTTSEEIKNASESYVINLLTETEQYLSANLQEVQQTKNRIHNRKNKN